MLTTTIYDSREYHRLLEEGWIMMYKLTVGYHTYACMVYPVSPAQEND